MLARTCWKQQNDDSSSFHSFTFLKLCGVTGPQHTCVYEASRFISEQVTDCGLCYGVKCMADLGLALWGSPCLKCGYAVGPQGPLWDHRALCGTKGPSVVRVDSSNPAADLQGPWREMFIDLLTHNQIITCFVSILYHLTSCLVKHIVTNSLWLSAIICGSLLTSWDTFKPCGSGMRQNNH